MRFLKSVICAAAYLLFLFSCQGKLAEKPKPKKLVYTIDDWKKQIMASSWLEAKETPPENVPNLTEVRPSSHPYFILYGNFNNNGKPDAIFIETRSSSATPLPSIKDPWLSSSMLETLRLYIYEWNGKAWVFLASLNSKGVLNNLRKLEEPLEVMLGRGDEGQPLDKPSGCYSISIFTGDHFEDLSKPFVKDPDDPWVPSRCLEINFRNLRWDGGKDLYWSSSNTYLFTDVNTGGVTVHENLADNCLIFPKNDKP